MLGPTPFNAVKQHKPLTSVSQLVEESIENRSDLSASRFHLPHVMTTLTHHLAYR